MIQFRTWRNDVAPWYETRARFFPPGGQFRMKQVSAIWMKHSRAKGMRIFMARPLEEKMFTAVKIRRDRE